MHLFFEMGVDTGVDLRQVCSRRPRERRRSCSGSRRRSSFALQGGTKEDVLERGRVAPREERP